MPITKYDQHASEDLFDEDIGCTICHPALSKGIASGWTKFYMENLFKDAIREGKKPHEIMIEAQRGYDKLREDRRKENKSNGARGGHGGSGNGNVYELMTTELLRRFSRVDVYFHAFCRKIQGKHNKFDLYIEHDKKPWIFSLQRSTKGDRTEIIQKQNLLLMEEGYRSRVNHVFLYHETDPAHDAFPANRHEIQVVCSAKPEFDDFLGMLRREGCSNKPIREEFYYDKLCKRYIQ